MALVISSPNDITTSNPTIELRTALQDFEAALTQDQVQSYKANSSKPTAESVTLFVASIAAKNQGPHGQFLWRRLCPFLEATRQFTGVVNQFVSSNPSLAGLIWGGIRTTLLAADNATAYFDQVVELIKEIGRTSPTLSEFGQLYTHHIGLQSALCRYYTIVIQICTKIVTDLRRSNTKHLLSTFFTPFVIDFKPLLSSLARSKESFHEQLLLASNQASIDRHKFVEQESKEQRKSRQLVSKIWTETKKEQDFMERYREKQLLLRAAQLKDEIRSNLSQINYMVAWRQALQPRVCGTAEWFKNDPAFQNWKMQSATATLWCRGTIGVGKTVFVSNMVAHLLENKPSADTVSFHFCRRDNPASLTDRAIIGTIVSQMLVGKLDDMEAKVLEQLRKDSQDIDLEGMIQLMVPYVNRDGAMHFIVIDGLDDCDSKDASRVQKALSELCSLSSGTFKLLYSARPDFIDERRVTTSPIYKINLTRSKVQNDINTYVDVSIEQCIEEKKLILSDSGLKSEILKCLKDSSDGMFLWVRLFIGELCACSSDEEISQALNHPPKGLGELVRSIVLRIKDQTSVQYALRTLQYCGVAKRPLQMFEMQELLSVEQDQTSFDRRKMPNDMDRVVSSCRGLVFVDEVDETLHYVHNSLRGYLFGETMSGCEISEENTTNLLLGYLCITYLGYTDFQRQLRRTYAGSSAQIQPLQIALQATSSEKTLSYWKLRKLQQKKVELESISMREISSKVEDMLGDQTSSRLQNEIETRRYHFLNYAKQYWIEHLRYFQHEDSTRMWDVFVSLVRQSDTPAIRPWLEFGPDSTTVPREHVTDLKLIHWAAYNDYPAFLATVFLARSMMYLINDMTELFSMSIFRPRLHRVSRTISKGMTPLLLEDTMAKALQKALATGDERAVALLIECGASSTFGEPGGAPLIRAIMQGWVPLVKVLIHTDAAVGWTINSSPLELAVSEMNIDIITAVLEAGVDVDYHEGYMSPLARAAAHGSYDIVDKLLRAGASVNQSCERSEGSEGRAEESHTELDPWEVWPSRHPKPVETTITTPLMEGIRSRSFEVVQRLLSAGAVVDPVIFGIKSSPLIDAIRYGDDSIVECLLAHRADPNRCFAADSPLLIAIRKLNIPIVRILLNYGADPTLVVSGVSPLVAAIQQDHLEMVKMVKMFIDKGVKVDSLRQRGVDPLLTAIRQDNLLLVEMLLEAGIDATGKLALGLTSANTAQLDSAQRQSHTSDADYLYAAAQRNNPKMVRRLLDAGAVVTSDIPGDTALMAAIRHRNFDMVKLFVSSGAHLDVTVSAESALILAISSNYPEIVDFLLAAGADVNKIAETDAPIMAATRLGDMRIIDLLLTAGATIDVCIGNETPLTLAILTDNMALVDKFLNVCPIVNSLVNNQSPLMIAVARSLTTTAKLYQASEGVASQIQGRSVLRVAIRSSSLEIVRKLMAAGLDVSARLPKGDFVLLDSVNPSNPGHVERLTEPGADPKTGVEIRPNFMTKAALVGNAKVIEAMLHVSPDQRGVGHHRSVYWLSIV